MKICTHFLQASHPYSFLTSPVSIVSCLNLVQVIRDEPALQQQQPGVNDDDNDGVPTYAELAPSRRVTEQAARIVSNSTAVYALIVHPQP